jgi:hypothetical protein
MPDWPRPYHPVVDGDVDRATVLHVYAHTPGRADALIAWAGGGEVTLVAGAPCVILPGSRPYTSRLVGLGDVAVSDGRTSAYAVSGAELSTRLWPVDVDEAPPAD